MAGENRREVVVRHRLGAVRRVLADLTDRRDTSAKTIAWRLDEVYGQEIFYSSPIRMGGGWIMVDSWGRKRRWDPVVLVHIPNPLSVPFLMISTKFRILGNYIPVPERRQKCPKR